MFTFSSPDESKRAARTVAGRALLLLGAAWCLGSSSPALAAGAGARAAPAAKARAPARARPAVPRLGAAEIVRRNVAARGGLKAWRAVEALTLKGRMDAGTGDSVARSMAVARPGPSSRKALREAAAAAARERAAQQVELPFTLERERPNRSRLEIEFAGKTAVQVFDGKNGWKVRPYLNRTDAEPFTAEEQEAEAESPGLDGLLIGYEAKGTKVALAGVERVEGRDAYKLEVTTRTGAVRHVWIDAHSFLDVKVEGVPRRMDGKMHAVWVYQRDFRSVRGLKIPFVLETAIDGYPQTHTIHFEKVAVNPKLDPAAFARPKA